MGMENTCGRAVCDCELCWSCVCVCVRICRIMHLNLIKLHYNYYTIFFKYNYLVNSDRACICHIYIVNNINGESGGCGCNVGIVRFKMMQPVYIYVCVILYKMPCKHVICVYVCVGVYSDFETSTLYGCLICKNVLRDA